MQPGLNVVCGPHGAGKSAIDRLVRGLPLASRPRQPHASWTEPEDVTGTVHWNDQGQQFHWSHLSGSSLNGSSLNGSSQGPRPWDAVSPGVWETIFHGRLGEVHPEQLWRLAREARVQDVAGRQADPTYENLKARERELLDQLRLLGTPQQEWSWCQQHRDQLADQIRRAEQAHQQATASTARLRLDHESAALRSWKGRRDALKKEAHQLRQWESEALAAVDRLQRQCDRLSTAQPDPFDGTNSLSGHVGYSESYRWSASAIGPERRQQLAAMEQQLDRWRQTLREIRDHRKRLQESAEDLRLDQRMDLGSASNQHPQRGLNALQEQILGTRHQLQEILNRYDSATDQRDTGGTLPFSLPNTLRNMHQELFEVSQQVSRRESLAAAEHLMQQAQQLQRCESELLSSIENLITDRGRLIQRIADENHISIERLHLALGQWTTEPPADPTVPWTTGEPARREDLESQASQRHARRLALQAQIAQRRSDLEQHRNRISEIDIELHHLRSARKKEKEMGRHARMLEGSLATLPSLLQLEQWRRDLAVADRTLADWQLRREKEKELVQVQADLRNRSPWRDSPSHTLEDEAGVYLAELLGVARASLPAWALENAWDRRAHGDDYMPATHSEERQLVELAMRLAVVEALGRRGIRLPMILDDAFCGVRAEALERALHCLENFAARDYQILLLTSDQSLAHRVRSGGGGVCYLRPSANVNARRLPVEIPASYVSYTREPNDDHVWRPIRVRRLPRTQEVDADPSEINRFLTGYANADQWDGWSSLPPEPIGYRLAPRYAQGSRRDFADDHDLPSDNRWRSTDLTKSRRFFLAESSAVDEIPGMDLRWAHRLRQNGVSRVSHFLDAEPHWVVDTIRSNWVQRDAVRAMQAASNLMCRVPHLRAFDARLLVGCGIVEPRQLQQTHPARLAAMVDQFLGSEAGQLILRTGNKYELSRIMSWISAARQRYGLPQSNRTTWPTFGQEHTSQNPNWDRVAQRPLPADRLGAWINDGWPAERAYAQRDGSDFARYARDPRHPSADWDRAGDSVANDRAARAGSGLDRADGDRGERADWDRPHRSNRRRQLRSSRPGTRSGRIRAMRASQGPATHVASTTRDYRSPVVQRRSTAPREEKRRVVSMSSSSGVSSGTGTLKFYLDPQSPVVDAPSIGDAMAERLQRIGIKYVSDLLAANPESVAQNLDARKVTAQVVVAWQHQARLVCRIPFLRGHDAQLLVLAGFTSPEQLRSASVPDIHARVAQAASSKDGMRYLRGASSPDLAEVADWHTWAAQSRTLRAA